MRKQLRHHVGHRPVPCAVHDRDGEQQRPGDSLRTLTDDHAHLWTIAAGERDSSTRPSAQQGSFGTKRSWSQLRSQSPLSPWRSDDVRRCRARALSGHRSREPHAHGRPQTKIGQLVMRRSRVRIPKAARPKPQPRVTLSWGFCVQWMRRRRRARAVPMCMSVGMSTPSSFRSGDMLLSQLSGGASRRCGSPRVCRGGRALLPCSPKAPAESAADAVGHGDPVSRSAGGS
ncbi:hypothetical protein MBT84_19625 [Streptomyces sp. MBT84]|nr:hypothetical protein [Streptomyces sp. MBT84]